MRYLVTGGAGFIGTNLCERLVQDGHDVRVIDNLSVSDVNVPHLESIGVKVVVADIASYDAIETHFKNIDVVIHLAAMNRAQRSIEQPLEANAVNISGTLHCLQAAHVHKVSRFVNISSSSVYANERDVLLEEDMPLAPPHPYGVGKLTGEHYARIYRDIFELETVSLRFFSVYGPRQLGDIDKAGVVAKFIHHAETDQPLEIYGDGEQMRNFSYVGDVVECVIRAAEMPVAGEIINIASPEEVSVKELANIVTEVTGKDAEIKHSDALKGDPARNPANTKKCEQLLGYVPSCTFSEGIKKTLAWYRDRAQ